MRYILYGKDMYKEKGIHCRQHRPGRWQVYFTHEGKQIHLQRDQEGHILKSERQAIHLMGYIDKNGYDPRVFGRGKEYNFSEAVKTWIDLSTCSEEWKKERTRLVNRFMLPYFAKMNIKGIKTIHVD